MRPERVTTESPINSGDSADQRTEGSHQRICSAWAALWQSENKMDGKTRYIIYRNLLPALFKTRKQARDYIEKEYSYIRNRPDLKAEPHGWRMPKAIRVTITPNEKALRPATEGEP